MIPSDKKALLFLLGHAVRGAAGGVTAGLGLLVLDVGNLRTLALHDADGALALALLFFALAASFAAAAVGGAFSDPSCDLVLQLDFPFGSSVQVHHPTSYTASSGVFPRRIRTECVREVKRFHNEKGKGNCSIRRV